VSPVLCCPPSDRMKPDERKALVRNRKARHEFQIDDTLETGIVLVGSEVKSLREAHASLVDAYAEVRGGELWLVGAQIEKYPWANQFNHEPIHDRKLLAHRQEIRRLAAKVREKGYTLVPLEIYLRAGKIKVEVALARGKRQYEKRAAKRAREAEREMEREE
jgi:SsrA-binding protein